MVPCCRSVRLLVSFLELVKYFTVSYRIVSNRIAVARGVESESSFWMRLRLRVRRPTPWLFVQLSMVVRGFGRCAVHYFEELIFSLHSSWNTQSQYHTWYPGVGIWILSSESESECHNTTIKLGLRIPGSSRLQYREAPFTRYNLLSYRLSTGCTTGLTTVLNEQWLFVVSCKRGTTDDNSQTRDQWRRLLIT